MRFIVGSMNPSKIRSVIEALAEYEEFRNAPVLSTKASSGVSEQPLSLEEICLGAQNRARSAYLLSRTCVGLHGRSRSEHEVSPLLNYSIGLESGFIEVPYTKTGMMVQSACMIFDGMNFFPGLSSAFECPARVVKYVLESGFDLNQAFKAAGLTEDPKLGERVGAIGVLSKGHVTRSDYLKQAIRVALFHLQNPGLY